MQPEPRTFPLCIAAGFVLTPLACLAALTIVADGTDLNEPNWSTAGYGQTGHIFFAADGSLVGGNADLTTGMVKSGPAW